MMVDLVRRHSLTERTLYRRKRCSGMQSTEVERQRKWKKTACSGDSWREARKLFEVEDLLGRKVGDARAAAHSGRPPDAHRRIVGDSSVPLRGFGELILSAIGLLAMSPH